MQVIGSLEYGDDRLASLFQDDIQSQCIATDRIIGQQPLGPPVPEDMKAVTAGISLKIWGSFSVDLEFLKVHGEIRIEIHAINLAVGCDIYLIPLESRLGGAYLIHPNGRRWNRDSGCQGSAFKSGIVL